MANSSLKSMRLIAQKYAVPDQHAQTNIDFVRLIHSSRPTSVNHGILKPSFCLILGGQKQILIGDRSISYGPGDFLVSSLEIPTSGRIKGATPENPYIGLSISIDPEEINEIVSEGEIEIPASSEMVPAAFVSESDPEIRDACDRLLRLLVQKKPSRFLAKSIRREILYYLLTGPYGALFYQNLVSKKSGEGIARAIQWIRQHIDEPLNVPELARVAGMSVSSLHHKFKAITTKGPLQYQKQLRLVKARQLLIGDQALDISYVAGEVGYASQSQFTREYRRLFGEAPRKDIQRLQKSPKHILQD